MIHGNDNKVQPVIGRRITEVDAGASFLTLTFDDGSKLEIEADSFYGSPTLDLELKAATA